MELTVTDSDGTALANVIFTTIEDRRGRIILSVRDQHTQSSLRRRRLMTLLQLFLVHRYHAAAVHYLTPTEDNRRQAERMRDIGIFDAVTEEVGEIIVADIAQAAVRDLVAGDSPLLAGLMVKGT